MLTYASTCREAEAPEISEHAKRSPVWCDTPESISPVLVVDDDPDIAPLVELAMRPFRIPMESVASGAEAIERFKERTYNLVILDLAMGDVHGFDVLRQLRGQPQVSRTPVLILTANVTHEALARSFGYGDDEFVKKPFDVCELGMRAFRLIRPFDH